MDLNFRLIWLPEVDSTNDYLKLNAENNFDRKPVIAYTNNQTAGKGQHQNHWDSEPYKNLALSVLLYPELPTEHSFYLSKITALAVHRLVESLVSSTAIKWTNDIIVGNKKIAGVLIDNSIKGNIINRSIIGVGLNVNQMSFPQHLPNATSLNLITGNNFDIDGLVHDFISYFQFFFRKYNAGNLESLDNNYNSCLYRKNEPITHQLTGEKWQVQSVDAEGYLLAKDSTGNLSKFAYEQNLFKF